MQLFMRNIAFAVTETDIIDEVAKILHRPPFPNAPLINFHVELFYRDRSTTHRGIGLLTLPNAEIGELFLRLYGSSSISIKSRTITFTRNKNSSHQAMIDKVNSTPWEDTKASQTKQKRMLDASQPIPLVRFSFGRFRRDGTYSEEIQMSGDTTSVVCNMDTRQLQLHRETYTEEEVSYGLLDLNTKISVSYYAGTILALASLSGPRKPFYVFLESELPPTAEKMATSDLLQEIFGPSSRPRIQHASLNHREFTPSMSRNLCLTFKSQVDVDTFLQRCKMLHLPRPQNREISKLNCDVYAENHLTRLDSFVKALEFKLAFEVEKAVVNGVFEPLEILDSLGSDILRLQQEHGLEAASIFRHFAERTMEPSLKVHHSSRGSNNPSRNLPQQLSDSVAIYLNELNRPKSRFSPSNAVFQSYHFIITPSTKILEGPLPDQTNSVLRRFENYDCFLRVSFQDENRSKPRRGSPLDDILETRLKPILVNGLNLAGRRYSFLGYSMSGLKSYSFFFVRPFTFNGEVLDARKIRSKLGNFQELIYRPALLGARWAQAFSTSDPSVTLDDSKITDIDDRTSAAGSVFTDGCGTISPDLARVVWKKLQGAKRSLARSKEVPSCFQIRLGGAKGVLVQDPTISGQVVCLRPSQKKFTTTTVRTLDITTTSNRPQPFFLNRPLIILLEHHGVPDKSFIDLEDIAISAVQITRTSLVEASKMFSQHGLGASFRLPSLYSNLRSVLGLDINSSSNLQNELISSCTVYGMTHVLRDIKHRARIPVPGSFTLIGVSDEWNCLREGEIYATIKDERTGHYQAIEGRILITRSPQIHPGDVQFVNAVRRPELAHLHNVVVFSCQGSRSLPSCLGGGDLDGDIYNLILDKNLFPPNGYTSNPGSYKSLPYKTLTRKCTVTDVADFVIDYIKSDLVGIISILHMRIADLKGPACDDCIKLATLNSHAVDFPKRGTAVDYKSLPDPPERLRPDYLSGEGVNPTNSDKFYPSKKILGALFRRVPEEEYHPDPHNLDNPSDGERIIEALSSLNIARIGFHSMVSQPDGVLMKEMRHIMAAYTDQLSVIAKTHTVSRRVNDQLSEAELVSGTIQAKWVDTSKRREAVTAMNMQTQELTKAIRHEFCGVATNSGNESDEDEEELDGLNLREEQRVAVENETFKRAWAGWLTAEEALHEDPRCFGPQSFGLIALGTLLELIKGRQSEADAGFWVLED